MKTIQSLVPIFGSNRTNASRPAELLRDCEFVYVPFAGGMCEVPHFKANSIIVNDLHRHIINLARVVANEPSLLSLQERLRDLMFHPDELEAAQIACKRRETNTYVGKDCPIWWAQDYFVSAWMGRSGNAGTKSEFDTSFAIRWDNGGGGSNVRYRNAIEMLKDFHKAFKRCMFSCEDCFDFLDKCKDRKNYGIYCDSPFPGGIGAQYKHTMDNSKLELLAKRLHQFENASIVIRYYRHPLIEEWYPRKLWQWQEFEGKRQNNTLGPEVLISRRCNYALIENGKEIEAHHLQRNSDPRTSDLTAREITSHLAKLHRWAIECVRKTPGKTALELAREFCPTDPRKISRRLSECEKKGLLRRGSARTCTISGRQAEVWWTA